MIYTVNFVEMSGRIETDVITKQLEDTGWAPHQAKTEGISKIYQIDRGDKIFHVEIPLDKNEKGYNEQMYRVAQEIAEFKKVSTEQVILEMINPLSDIINVKILGNKSENNVLMEDSVKLYEFIKKLLLATTLDMTSPGYSHIGRPEKKAQKFTDSCRFGQTKIGTDSVSVVCPFAELNDGEYTQLSIFSDNDLHVSSFTRHATTNLMTFLNDVCSAANNNTLDAYVQQKGLQGNHISINFLEALKNLISFKENTTVEISLNWAPTVKNIAHIDSNVMFTKEALEPITRAIELLKYLTAGEITVEGFITKLESEPDINKRTTGKVEISLTEEGISRTIIANLALDAYNKALLAHKDGKTVQITGKVSGGKKKHITDGRIAVLD